MQLCPLLGLLQVRQVKDCISLNSCFLKNLLFVKKICQHSSQLVHVCLPSSANITPHPPPQISRKPTQLGRYTCESKSLAHDAPTFRLMSFLLGFLGDQRVPSTNAFIDIRRLYALLLLPAQ